MSEYTLKFSPSLITDTGSYRLLELPSDLCKTIEASIAGNANTASPSVSIRGNPDEDAVLCTTDKTYTIRSVVLSNSVLVVTPSATRGEAGEEGGVAAVIRDQLSEVLELVPSVPRLHKLDVLLKGREYDEGREEDEDMSDVDGSRPLKRQRLSYEDARESVQASDQELARGLKDRRVLILEGDLRPIAPSYLTAILELLLTHLVSLSLPHEAAAIEELLVALEDGYDVRRDICKQVMSWFGVISDGKWRMDVPAVVREVGLGVLRPYKDEPIAQEQFLAKWLKTVGDTFESTALLDLLSGNYLSSTDTLKDPPVTMLTYFSSSQLPTDPASRFTDLFLTRSRWKAEEIAPFLADIVVDFKERDKFLLKYARAITDATGVWYTARAKYNG